MADTAVSVSSVGGEEAKDKVKKKKSALKKSNPDGTEVVKRSSKKSKEPKEETEVADSAQDTVATKSEEVVVPNGIENGANEEILPVECEVEKTEAELAAEEIRRKNFDVSHIKSAERYAIPVATKSSDVEALRDLDERKLCELKEAFHLFDLDGDGIIDASDLRATFLTMGQEVAESQVQQMLNEALDPLDFDAFVVLLGYKTIELDPEEVLVEALSKWDKDGKGFISEERIRHDLMSFGDKFTDKEVMIALEEAPILKVKGPIDINNPPPEMIDYPAFCKILGGLRKRNRDKQQQGLPELIFEH